MTALGTIVDRRRLERFLPWFGAAVLAAGVATFVAVHEWGGSSSAPVAPVANAPSRQAPAAKQKTVGVPSDAREVAVQFIATAVARKHVARSYDLTTPTLRSGVTRKQWLTSEIPVQPYPVTRKTLDSARFTTDYAHPGDVQLEVLLSPPKGVNQQPGYFVIGLVKRGAHWKVDYWNTRATIPVPSGSG